MTKDEMIKDIRAIIDDRCEAELGQVHAESKGGKVTKTVSTSLIAKDIYEAGYRKVADDEFVLKQDEVWEFRKDQAEVKFLKDKIKQETAREILQEMFGYMGSHQKFCIVDYEHKTLIDLDGLWAKGAELAKKFGIELE